MASAPAPVPTRRAIPVLASVLLMGGVLVGVVQGGTAGAVGTTACGRDWFDGATTAWTAWWSGSAVLGGSELTLQPTTGAVTARAIVGPGECGGPVTAATFTLRTSSGSAVAYVKFVDAAGAAVVRGPFAVSAEATVVTASPDGLVPALVGIEAYPSVSGASLAVLDATITAELPTTTVAPVTTTIAPGSSCVDGFEAGAGAWTPWWSGTTAITAVQPRSGGAALALTGSPGTAYRSPFPTSCGTQLRMHLRATSGAATVWVKALDQRTGGSSLSGPYSVGATWQALDVALPSDGPAAIGVEAYGPVALDDVTLSGSVATTTTTTTTAPSTTTTTATTTTTTTTVPAGSSPACVDGFETGTDGWTTWWSGSVPERRTSALVAHSGNGSLLLLGNGTAPVTALRSLVPAACGGIVTRISVWVWSGDATTLWLKAIDDRSGRETQLGPFTVPSTPDVRPKLVQIPVSLSGPTTLGLQIDSTFAYVDDVVYDTAAAPGALPGPPTAVTDATGSGFVFGASAPADAPVLFFRSLLIRTSPIGITGLQPPLQVESVPGQTASFDVSGWSADLPVSAAAYHHLPRFPGYVVACNRFGCGERSSIGAAEVRPTPATACKVEDFDDPADATRWRAWDTGAPSVVVPVIAGVPSWQPWGNSLRPGQVVTSLTPNGYHYDAAVQRTILPGECGSRTIRSLDLATVGNDAAPTVQIVDDGTGAVTPYVLGAPLPPIPPAGLTLRLRTSATFVGEKYAKPTFTILSFVLHGG